jgi:D-alanyl-lipoteichoic acid acyltransferase DltB (MBOAT superfamily)
MVFNSFKFLLFFIAVLSLFFFIPQKQRKYFLLLASYFFYMSWHWEYGFLLLFSTLVQYYCAIQIEKNASHLPLKKLYLYVGIGTDLSMLFFFKYFDFVGSNIISMGNLLGFQYSWTHLNILLPVGISFYVFQTLSYTVDVYHGKMKAERDFSYFALYVSFFSQLVAGPIERASYLFASIKRNKSI